MKTDRFHCCATCIHFHVDTTEKPISYICERLGYETNPKYQFNCWSPKKTVQRLIKKNNQNI